MKKLAILLVSAFTLVCHGALTNTTFAISVTGGTGSIYIFNGKPPAPEHPMLIATNQSPIGTNVAVYNGHAYSIDIIGNNLVRDGQIVGPLFWYSGKIDVTTHYGWCIDQTEGVGYLAAQENDGDPQDYLWAVDLSTGRVTFIDFIGTNNGQVLINGMTGITFTGVLEGHPVQVRQEL